MHLLCRNFNFMIPYMDIYDEKQSDSKVLHRPADSSLWAQTGADAMNYVEERVKEMNIEKEQNELGRYKSFMEERRKSMIVPPRTNCAILDTVVVSRPSSALQEEKKSELEEEPTLDAIESVIDPEEELLHERLDELGKTKKKLNKLVDYVQGVANRKIIGAWDMLKETYKQSSTFEVVINEKSQKPMQIKTLPIENIVTLLASPEIQLNKSEIESMCTKLDLPSNDIAKVRRLSAMNIARNVTINEGVRELCDAEIDNIRKDFKEKYVNIVQLKSSVFPDDPALLEFEMKMIEKEKIAKRMIEDEENKKKLAYAEIVEQRRLKGIEDFQRALDQLQYSRGLMTPPREYMLREVIGYAQHVLSAQEAASMTVIDPAIIRSLGPQAFEFSGDQKCFPNLASMGSFLEEAGQSFDGSEMQTSPLSPSRRPASGSQFRTNLKGVTAEQLLEMKSKPPLKLHTPEIVMKLLFDAVSLGKGLNGVSFKDVIELVQCFATTRIQAFFRCHTKRWRFDKARKCWKKAFSATKGRVFTAWAQESRKIGELKRKCMRKVVAWRFFAKRLQERQHYFKQCYWPFHVWRRSVLKSSTVKQKTKFLCGRVMPTLITMRTFRAWRDLVKSENFYTKRAKLFRQNRLNKEKRDSYFWLKYWVIRRKRLRHNWLHEGLTMKRKFDDLCVKRPFQVWYSWIQLKKRLNSSIRANCSLFRSFIFPNKGFECDREIHFISPEPSIMSDIKPKSSSSSITTRTKDSSKGKKKKKKRKSIKDDPGFLQMVQTYGKRKPLKFDKFKEFKWSMKQVRYDIESDEEVHDNAFPVESLLNDMFSRPTSKASRRPSAVGAIIRPPGSNSRPGTSEDFSLPGTAEESRKGSRRSSRPVNIVLGEVNMFAEEKLEDGESVGTCASSISKTDEEPTYNTVSEMLKKVFDQQKIKIADYDPISIFYRIKPVTVQNIAVVQTFMDDVETGALIESAFRYHRWAMRAFRNLQRFAKIQINFRKGLRKKRHERLRFVFKVLNDNLNRSISADITFSVTEQLINEARIAKVDKFARRRELTDAIKAYNERQIELERMRIQAFKASLRNSSTAATKGSGRTSANSSRAQTPATGLLATGSAVDEKESFFADDSLVSVGNFQNLSTASADSRSATPSQEKRQKPPKSGGGRRNIVQVSVRKPGSRGTVRSREGDSSSGYSVSCSLGNETAAGSEFGSNLVI